VNSAAAVAAVFAVLQGVQAAGPNLYDQLRFANVDAAFDNLFLDTKTVPGQAYIHAWMTTRDGTATADVAMQAGRAVHTIVLTGYRGFQDGISEPLWQAEVDAIASALFPYSGRHLETEGSGVYFDWSGPPKIEGVKLVWFGRYLCHTARITHTVEEFPL
jgi:hypothetical protein